MQAKHKKQQICESLSQTKKQNVCVCLGGGGITHSKVDTKVWFGAKGGQQIIKNGSTFFINALISMFCSTGEEERALQPAAVCICALALSSWQDLVPLRGFGVVSPINSDLHKVPQMCTSAGIIKSLSRGRWLTGCIQSVDRRDKDKDVELGFLLLHPREQWCEYSSFKF